MIRGLTSFCLLNQKTPSFKKMTRKYQLIGQEAEQRVIDLARDLGSEVYTSQDLDYGGKVDVVIDNAPYQVSATGKSKRTEKRLTSLGIRPITAGQQVSDEDLLEQLSNY